MNSLNITNVIIDTDDIYFRAGLAYIIKSYFNKNQQTVSFLSTEKIDLLIRHEHSIPLKKEGKEIIIRGRYNKATSAQRACLCKNILFKHDTPERFVFLLKKTIKNEVAKTPCIVCRRKLTRREMQILNKLLDGLSLSEIARCIGIHVESVSQHKRNAMRKLSLRNTRELINWLFFNKANLNVDNRLDE